MRGVAAVLVVISLGVLTLVAVSRHDVGVAVSSVSLLAGWLAIIAWRGPRILHSVALGLATLLCALGAAMHLPFSAILVALSGSIGAWDLCLMEQRTSTYPREATHRVHRRYIRRNLTLIAAAGVIAAAAYSLRVRMSFGVSFALSCVCFVLFAVVFRRSQSLMNPTPATEQEERAAKPPA